MNALKLFFKTILQIYTKIVKMTSKWHVLMSIKSLMSKKTQNKWKTKQKQTQNQRTDWWLWKGLGEERMGEGGQKRN